MKTTRLTAMLLLAGAMILPATQISAQTRKSGARKTTATAKKATAAKPAAATKSVSLADSYYEGIVKMKGQPMDFFSTLNFSSSDGAFNFAGAADFPVTYTAPEAAGKMTITLTSKVVNGTLTSKDKGSSMDGTINFNGNTLTAWFVKVNKNHTTPTVSDEELMTIVGNPDGYTAFVIGEQGGQKVCFPADMTLNANDKSYSVTFDNAIVQQIFSKLAGDYNVQDKMLVLSDASGKRISGKIYDDGTYITLPMGSAQGFGFSLLMIR